MKIFNLKITCYGKLLSITENSSVEEICNFIDNYKELLPKNSIKEALSTLNIGEKMQMNWHINESKLLGMIPKYNRDIELLRIN